jgi:hypothetical protein
VDAHETPSQLQEAIKECTEVDAEYEEVARVLTKKVNMTKRPNDEDSISGNKQALFREQ